VLAERGLERDVDVRKRLEILIGDCGSRLLTDIRRGRLSRRRRRRHRLLCKPVRREDERSGGRQRCEYASHLTILCNLNERILVQAACHAVAYRPPTSDGGDSVPDRRQRWDS